MEHLVNTLRHDYSHLIFTPGPVAHWSPATNQVIYKSGNTSEAVWTLLHELGHALLDHASYKSDVDLLQKEVAAWEKAASLARHYGKTVDAQYIQGCLDTYRDWLYKRSTCPLCENHGIQSSEHVYTCVNCHNTWRVTWARFCRPYRRLNIPTTK